MAGSAKSEKVGSTKRQMCRGHLERGEWFTVGTLPSGEHRPYETEIFSDGRRFHYCERCAAERGMTLDRGGEGQS